MQQNRQAPVTGIDSHAHVFERNLPLTSGRRYAPDYDATLASYLALLEANGLSHGVLVQPSFLGTDNRYLLHAVAQAPERLRAVVVVDRTIAPQALAQMHAAGARGVRLNLMGQPLPDLAGPSWQPFFEHLNTLGWHVELHRQLPDIPALLRPLLARGCKVVVDHLGRGQALDGLTQPGFHELLALGREGNVWMKVSGLYRLGGTHAEQTRFAQQAVALLEQHWAPDRLLWGSDWPHTQHEGQVSFEAELRRFMELGVAQQASILKHNAAVLFDFPLTSGS